MANFAPSQLAAARLYASTKTIAPDSLISLTSEEYKHQKTQRLQHSGKTKEDDKDEVLAVGSSSTKWKGKLEFLRGLCWNCGKKGHFKDKCPKPAKSTKDLKKEDISAKKTNSTNAAIESDSESEVAFVMSWDSKSDDSGSENLRARKVNVRHVIQISV